ncbi:MAG: PKD domain-containing protein [Bacteroidales bacterium]|nr:PKD domain-containing protein [Bacteroidales bacterium]
MNTIKKIISTLAFLVISILAVAQDCEAWFDVEQDSVNTHKFYFFDGSAPQGDIIYRQWAFGDGTNSTLQNPVHTYSSDGVYYAALYIMTSSCSDTFIYVIDVGNTFSECATDFSYVIDTMSHAVHFFGLYFSENNNDIEWLWDFGDGQSSVLKNPVHSYAVDSSYYVTLTANDTVCSSTRTRVVHLDVDSFEEDCQAMFSFYYTDPAGLNFLFYNESWVQDSVFNVTWDFGDGATSTLLNPSHNYTSEGEYDVTMVIATQGCSASIVKRVYAGENSWYPDFCQAMFYFTQNQSDLFEFHFSDASYYTGSTNAWHWDFGDGHTSYLQNPVNIYSETGIYDVNLEIMSDSCTSNFLMQIYVSNDSLYGGGLEAMFYPEFLDLNTVYFHNISEGTYTDVFWDFGDGNYSYANDPTHDFDEVGIHEIALSIGNQTDTNTTVLTIDFGSQEVMFGANYPGGELLSVKENINNEIKVFPNPTTEKLFVITKDEIECEVVVYNSLGVTVLTKRINSFDNCIEVATLPAGVYFIKIYGKNSVSNAAFIKN